MKISSVIVFYILGAFANGSSTSPPEKELECYSQEKIYDRTTEKCYKLLTRGPCPRGHWFVLEKPKETLRGNPTIRGVCVREICKEGEYYWRENNTCVKGKDKKRLCGDGTGQELQTNVFGDAECACARDPPRARVRKQCYLLFTRGPCPPSQILGFVGNSEQPTCIPDPCYGETLYRKQQKKLSKDATLAVWDDGICYELGTRGPCPEGLTFKVHPKYRRPTCGTLLNHIFGGINGCNKDENGVCQKKAAQKKRSTADKFVKELEEILKKK